MAFTWSGTRSHARPGGRTRVTRGTCGAAASVAVVLGLTLAAPAVAGSPATAVPSALPAPTTGAEVFLRPSDGIFDVVGGGFGHGIGMSQHGAQGAAAAGRTHSQILAFYYPGTSLVQGGLSTITVGITVDDDGSLTVAASSGLAVTAGGTKTTLPTDRTRWRVRATSTSASSCVLEGLRSGTWGAYLAGKTPCPVAFTATAGSVETYLPGGERRLYRGTVQAVHTGTATLRTANRLSMQSYLASVVPAEMPPSWRADALEAQAVAARTYASRRAGATSWYDTCDTTACQVYRGMGRRNADGTVTSYEYPGSTAAVSATAGQVLTFRFSDGVTRLATTMFSSSNGGHSAAASSFHAYLAAQPDPYDAVSGNSRNRWSAQLPASALESRYGIHRVERIQILSRDGDGSWGGRVLSVKVEGTTSSGSYVSASTTGNGLVAARSWPTHSTGLSSNYFTILAPTTITRLAGSDRYGTAAQVSRLYAAGVPVVYVASGLTFPDALAGAPRAAVNGGPVLLTRPDSVPGATRDAMTRLRPERVVVLGGTGSVSDAVAEELRRLTTTGTLQRVGGADRYAVAAALAGYYPAGGEVAYVATGLTFPDALSGAALAGRDRAPVLLTRTDTLPTATKNALARLAPRRVVVLGGPGSVSDAVLTALGTYATSGTVTRISGADRYEVAANVAKRFGPEGTAMVAAGTVFPDALAGAARAGLEGYPVLLTRPSALPAVSATQLQRLDPDEVLVLGGTGSVEPAVVDDLRAALD